MIMVEELVFTCPLQKEQVDEVYTLDDLVKPGMGDVLGLIFLFKWQPEDGESGEEGDASRKPLDAVEFPHLFFARQMVSAGSYIIHENNNYCY